MEKDFIDVLERNKFVEKLENIIQNTDISKKGRCFALNGEWGAGKSIVVDMLIEKYDNKQDYFIIKYNAWENDFYEEPLIAMVSVIKKTVEEKILLKTILKEVGTSLLIVADEILCSLTEKVTGINISAIKEGCKLKHDKKYDNFVDFKTEIENLKHALEGFTKKTKIIIIIDELDRCLPEYAIKVLERLHHIFNDEKNILQIVAVDKNQLDKTINKIFGEYSASKYLEKFINFQIDLPVADFSDKFEDRFKDLLENYIEIDVFKNNDYRKIINACLQEMPIREKIQTLDKIALIHNLTVGEKSDYSVLCFEIIHYVSTYIYRLKINISLITKEYEGIRFFNVYEDKTVLQKRVMTNISKVMSSINLRPRSMYDEPYILLDFSNGDKNLYNAVYWYFSNSPDVKISCDNTLYSFLKTNSEICRKFKNGCEIIK
ncbi:MAG TPA: P-loop NTPase fold protein [Eubacteriales bacterium]|nr:P-loop NTPase fold protein [Eubacteriales bacterium]